MATWMTVSHFSWHLKKNPNRPVSSESAPQYLTDSWSTLYQYLVSLSAHFRCCYHYGEISVFARSIRCFGSEFWYLIARIRAQDPATEEWLSLPYSTQSNFMIFCHPAFLNIQRYRSTATGRQPGTWLDSCRFERSAEANGRFNWLLRSTRRRRSLP